MGCAEIRDIFGKDIVYLFQTLPHAAVVSSVAGTAQIGDTSRASHDTCDTSRASHDTYILYRISEPSTSTRMFKIPTVGGSYTNCVSDTYCCAAHIGNYRATREVPLPYRGWLPPESFRPIASSQDKEGRGGQSSLPHMAITFLARFFSFVFPRIPGFLLREREAASTFQTLNTSATCPRTQQTSPRIRTRGTDFVLDVWCRDGFHSWWGFVSSVLFCFASLDAVTPPAGV